MLGEVYLCCATEMPHTFRANQDPGRVPQQFDKYVCKEHLAEVNQCRRDKGLEELVVYADSYPDPETE